MKEFKINAQSDIIDDIISHLEGGSMGMAVARKFSYERKGDTLYFTLKPGQEPELSEIFWFGYLTNN